jgi:hypothetical protein
MKTQDTSIGMIVRTRILQLTAVGVLGLAPGAWATTISDDFNDGNDTAPTIAWQHYDPIALAVGGGTFVHWSFPGGNTYRMLADATPDPAAGPGRGGSIAPGDFANFYAAVDVVNWDSTTHQVFGILARVGTLGPGTTSGYLFNWDNGNPPTSTSGDMDIVRVDNESPTDLDNQAYFGNDSVHLETGHSYRFVFMGVGGTFRGQVYDLTNTVVPIVDYGVIDPSYDPNGTDHVSGPTGLLVFNNTPYDSYADATFDNFIATDGPLLYANFPLLSVSRPSANTVRISWPGVGNGASGSRVLTDSLQSSPSLTTPVWTPVTDGITQEGVENVYLVSPATNSQFFKLVLP